MDDDPVARAETLALVEDELDRMGRLVADLQTLTKSTQPAFLSLAAVDLAELTDEVLTRARALGERDWRTDGIAAGTAVADRQRLVQALLQLVSNALAHTGPGDTVAIGTGIDGDEVVLWVRDSGPGVPAGVRDRLFDRFVHGPASEGCGLGLSIVEAIARAHGGRAALLDPGPGSTRFGLVLPLRRVDPGGVP
jgi:signal transduction histidine kinase